MCCLSWCISLSRSLLRASTSSWVFFLLEADSSSSAILASFSLMAASRACCFISSISSSCFLRSCLMLVRWVSLSCRDCCVEERRCLVASSSCLVLSSVFISSSNFTWWPLSMELSLRRSCPRPFLSPWGPSLIFGPFLVWSLPPCLSNSAIFLSLSFFSVSTSRRMSRSLSTSV